MMVMMITSSRNAYLVLIMVMVVIVINIHPAATVYQTAF